MGKFKIIETPIKDLVLIETKIFRDNRGFFYGGHTIKKNLRR